MTATAAKSQLSVVSDQQPRGEVLRMIAWDEINTAPWNARKTFDKTANEELVKSIEQYGIQVPLIVRPFANDGFKFEIVAGNRRFNAAAALDLAEVPCIVRELTDDQAREIGLVDNLQREDVPALEEADAYAELQQRLGTVAAIAARVGKDVSYVARRLQLVTLGEMPRKALKERLITIDHALLLARLGEEEQNVNLKWMLNVNAGPKVSLESVIEERIKDRDAKDRWSGYWEPQSVLDLKHHLEQHVGRKLSRAPWSLDDTTLLQDVPACSSCPSNTKHNDTLFGDMNIAAATCEDGACFDMKRLAFVSIKLTQIPKETVKTKPVEGLNNLDRYLFPLRLSWKSTTVPPRVQRKGFEVDREGFAPEQVFRHGQWVEAKPKSCEFVRQGVTVDWSDADDRGYMGGQEKVRKPGQILSVCIAQKCKVHKKSYAGAKKDSGGGLINQNSEAARAKREERAKEAEAENEIRHAQFMKAVDQVKSVSGELLRAIVLRAMGTWLSAEDEERFPGLQKTLKSAKVDSQQFARAAACVLFVGDSHRAIWDAEWQPSADRTRKGFIEHLKLLGYDASKAWEKPKAEAKPAVKPAKKAGKTAAKKGGRK